MVHGQHAVEASVHAAAKEPVCRVGAKRLQSLFLQLLYCRGYDFSLLVAHQAIVAGVWVEGEHGNAWVGNAEVALQTVEEDGGFLHDGVLCYGACHLADGQMGGDKSHTQSLVHQYHERLLAVAHTVFDVFGVSAEVERVVLYGAFVYRGGHQHVIKFRPVVGHGAVESLQRSLSGLFRRLSGLHLHVVLEGGEQVYAAVFGVLGIVYYAEVGLQVEHLPVVGGHFGRAVYYWSTQLQHLCVLESLEYNLVADAIGVSVRDGHAYWSVVFHCRLFFGAVAVLASAYCWFCLSCLCRCLLLPPSVGVFGERVECRLKSFHGVALLLSRGKHKALGDYRHAFAAVGHGHAHKRPSHRVAFHLP